MNLLRSCKMVFSIALCCSSVSLFAQKSTATDEPVSGGGEQFVNGEWKASLVADGSYDKVKHVGNPIPWQYIREADILWKKTVWRQIDVFEKQNIGFRYQGDENTGGGMFIEILLDAVKRGKVAAYSTFDDRFTTKLSKEQIIAAVSGTTDTIEVEDPVTNQMIKKIYKRDFKPEDIIKFDMKENWIFDRNQGKMIVRIVGISPLIVKRTDDGQIKGEQNMFWLNYSELRPVLAQYEVYNPQNEIARFTWDEFFETRQFASKITKISNSLDQRYETIFGQDARGKMEALYESQQDANEIFNKEHDMWVY